MTHFWPEASPHWDKLKAIIQDMPAERRELVISKIQDDIDEMLLEMQGDNFKT